MPEIVIDCDFEIIAGQYALVRLIVGDKSLYYLHDLYDLALGARTAQNGGEPW